MIKRVDTKMAGADLSAKSTRKEMERFSNVKFCRKCFTFSAKFHITKRSELELANEGLVISKLAEMPL